MAEFEDSLFVAGGHGVNGQVLQSVEVYNPHISKVFDRYPRLGATCSCFVYTSAYLFRACIKLGIFMQLCADAWASTSRSLSFAQWSSCLYFEYVSSAS